MPRILIVDDEPSIVMALKDELVFEGFEVDSASDGLAALEQVREFKPDVMLLDLALPGLNGFEVCRQIRPQMPDLWIIMVSVRGEEVDRVMGLELGADDYVTKPFSLREIVARIKVGLRRQSGKVLQASFKFGEVEIDLRAHRVTKKRKEVPLTRTEFKIIELLAERAGEVITRDEFLDAIWGEDFSITPRVIDTHITALRKKLEDDPNNPEHVLSVRGVGYRLHRNL
jgi:two-component system, OmpR family, alkaline phosphatase synthesis response regulator PhoP